MEDRKSEDGFRMGEDRNAGKRGVCDVGIDLVADLAGQGKEGRK